MDTLKPLLIPIIPNHPILPFDYVVFNLYKLPISWSSSRTFTFRNFQAPPPTPKVYLDKASIFEA